jgi:hypothetical protein
MRQACRRVKNPMPPISDMAFDTSFIHGAYVSYRVRKMASVAVFF